MSLYPGRRYVGDTVRLEVNWQQSDGTDVDPSTDVALRVLSPDGSTTSYTYSAAGITRENEGDYYIDIVPDRSGRWAYEWSATGTGTARKVQSSFVVQASPWDDLTLTSDYGRYC